MSYGAHKGQGLAQETLFSKVGLDSPSKWSQLWAKHYIMGNKSLEEAITQTVIDNIVSKLGAGTTIGELTPASLSKIRSEVAWGQTVSGNAYHHLGIDIMQAETWPEGTLILTEVPVGDNVYDGRVYYNGKTVVDLEFSKYAKAPKYKHELMRHNGEFFYFIVPGHDLTEGISKKMLARNCQPVFTFGCNHSSAISFDQMIKEIKNKITGLKLVAEMEENAALHETPNTASAT